MKSMEEIPIHLARSVHGFARDRLNALQHRARLIDNAFHLQTQTKHLFRMAQHELRFPQTSDHEIVIGFLCGKAHIVSQRRHNGPAQTRGDHKMATLTINRAVRQNGEKNKDGQFIHPAVPFALTLDFAGVSENDILALAADQIIVGQQAAMRRAFTAKDNKDKFPAIVARLSGRLKVAEYVAAQRAPGKSAFEKAMANVGKLTPEQRAALAKALSGK